MANLGGKPLKFKTVKELQTKIDEYFTECDPHPIQHEITKTDKKTGEVNTEMVTYLTGQKPYTVTGLAVFLDTTRETLLEYQGEVKGRQKKDSGYADAITRAKLRIHNFAEESLWSPKIATGVIFNLINNHGWKNKSEQDVNLKGSVSLTKLFEEAKKK